MKDQANPKRSCEKRKKGFLRVNTKLIKYI
jgi:hypothetical protein